VLEGLPEVLEAARAVWRAWLPDPLLRTLAGTLVMLVAMSIAIWALETWHGVRTRNYRSRQFGYDLAYYFYYRSGLHRVLFTATSLALLSTPLGWLDLGLLRPLPFAAQVVVGLLLSDLAMYWWHRAQHHYRFLWAFHTTHHASSQLTFAAYLRFHPLEVFFSDLVAFAVLRILGVEFEAWAAVFLVTTLLGEVQHSQLPWTYGPLRRVLVSPRFHAFHHTPDRATHDRNFGGLFAFWDHLFGTAVPDHVPAPTAFGLHDVRADSLLGTLTTPFRLLRSFYGRSPSGPEAAATAPAPPVVEEHAPREA
jgi:sterol desaturase/sphingolipid hydroxylase (fatty acid hydroxylase superfamily)